MRFYEDIPEDYFQKSENEKKSEEEKEEKIKIKKIPVEWNVAILHPWTFKMGQMVRSTPLHYIVAFLPYKKLISIFWLTLQ
jgi:hypothetical protein